MAGRAARGEQLFHPRDAAIPLGEAPGEDGPTEGFAVHDRAWNQAQLAENYQSFLEAFERQRRAAHRARPRQP